MADSTYSRTAATDIGILSRLRAQRFLQGQGKRVEIRRRQGREAAWLLDGVLHRVRVDAVAYRSGQILLDVSATDLPGVVVILIGPPLAEGGEPVMRVLVRPTAALLEADAKSIGTVHSDRGETSSISLPLGEIPGSDPAKWPAGWVLYPKTWRSKSDPKPPAHVSIEDLFGGDDSGGDDSGA